MKNTASPRIGASFSAKLSRLLQSKFPDTDRLIPGNILKEGLILDLGGGTPWKNGWIHEMYGPILQARGHCMDIDKKKTPHVVGDIMQLPFKDSCADAVICNAVLEHIPHPQAAIEEIHRTLKDGGGFFFYVPWMYPYHGGPHDYYRFSASSIHELFRPFSEYHIVARGKGSIRVALGFLVGYREPYIKILNFAVARPIEAIIKALAAWLKNHEHEDIANKLDLYLSDNIAHGYFVYGRK